MGDSPPVQDITVGDDGFMAVCVVCGFGGDLLCCDGQGCSIVMHTECAGLEEVRWQICRPSCSPSPFSTPAMRKGGLRTRNCSEGRGTHDGNWEDKDRLAGRRTPLASNTSRAGSSCTLVRPQRLVTSVSSR